MSEWWNDVAYLAYRDPVVVFVSYFYVHVRDRKRRNGPEMAGALVKAMLPFRQMVESGTLEPDKVRNLPLCMESYKYLFHACRYPAIPSDTVRKFSPLENNHIVVLRKNRFFIVPLTHPKTGQELSAAELEVQFKRIYELAGSVPHSTPIGVLTSDHRDRWALAREALLSHSVNRVLTHKIESAMMVLCLDDTSPVTREQLSWSTWVGNGRNRWYDKHQLIVYENGRSGFLGEHSCMDGTPTLRMNEFVLGGLASGKTSLGLPASTGTGNDLPHPQELVFAIDDKIRELVAAAEERFDDLIGRHDLEVLHYEGYGKSFMKKHKLSPDAWTQLVKQLAFHKMFGRPGVTYESAQTRKFKKGRTEVIRTASNEAGAWVHAMLDTNREKDATQIRTLFQRAVARHLQYSTWAADAQGVDRHLFGLKKSLKEGEEVPDLFRDEAYAKSSHWELSTSQLSSPYLDGWGYGEVVPDGYGLSYSIGDEYIRWTITSMKRDTAVLKHYLAEAATEVRDVLEAARKMEAEQVPAGVKAKM